MVRVASHPQRNRLQEVDQEITESEFIKTISERVKIGILLQTLPTHLQDGDLLRVAQNTGTGRAWRWQ